MLNHFTEKILRRRDSHASDNEGDAVQFTFEGSGISIIGELGPAQGIAEVSIIDNHISTMIAKTVIDAYCPSNVFGQVLYKNANLPRNSNYTITFKVRNQQNPNATDSLQTIDGFQYR